MRCIIHDEYSLKGKLTSELWYICIIRSTYGHQLYYQEYCFQMTKWKFWTYSASTCVHPDNNANNIPYKNAHYISTCIMIPQFPKQWTIPVWIILFLSDLDNQYHSFFSLTVAYAFTKLLSYLDIFIVPQFNSPCHELFVLAPLDSLWPSDAIWHQDLGHQ